MATEDPTAEKWLPVAGWEGKYEVSNLGRVRSLDRIVQYRGHLIRRLRGKMMKPSADGNGYLQAGFSSGGKLTQLRVNRLVLIAFCRPPLDGEVSNHINFVRTDNRIWNLEWVTRAGNNLHTMLANRFTPAVGERNGSAKITAVDVREIRLRVAAGELQRIVGADYGIRQAQVSEIVRRVSWGHIA